jgi:hypothetical protein
MFLKSRKPEAFNIYSREKVSFGRKFLVEEKLLEINKLELSKPSLECSRGKL